MYTGAALWKAVGPQKLKLEPPHDPTMLLLGIYPKKTKAVSQRDICTSIFTAALFTNPRYGNDQSVY